MRRRIRNISIIGIKGFILVFLLASLVACGQRKTDEKVVSVTIEPLRYFAERIAGDEFTIHCMVPDGQSPESYDPTPRQMVAVGESLAYLRIGTIGFEQAWMDNIQEIYPDLKIFDLSEGIRPHHSHGSVDPHTWTSIKGAKAIARNILEAFIALDLEHKEDYQANYEDLLREIEDTEQKVSALLSPLRGKAFIIYHPALTYLADEYGLTQLSIEMEGKEPSPAQLKKLIEMADAYEAKVVFVQKEFDQKNAEQIARETGCRLVPINPLDYHWSQEMIHIANALADGETD